MTMTETIKDNIIDELVGQRLKDTRHRCGLSQIQLAVVLGVSVAALSRWEHGNRNPRAKHLEQISHWLQQVN